MYCESSVLPKNTTQCPRLGLEPGALDPESSALTMRPSQIKLLTKNLMQQVTITMCELLTLVKNHNLDIIQS